MAQSQNKTASNNLDRFREARDRGGAYLLDHLGGDGSFPASSPGVDEYYKAVTAFQAIGRDDAAHRLCAWIRRHGMDADGNLGPRPDNVPEHLHAYQNAWVVCGAHRLGQFDLSTRGMRCLSRTWDAESGGFYASLTQRGDDVNQELMGSCMCGLAALVTGRIDMALGVGRWLAALMEAQPEFPHVLYTVCRRDGGLRTGPVAELDPRYVVLAGVERDQDFFNPGIAGGFLCRLFQATAEVSWLQLARRFMEFAEVANDFLFRIVRAGKVGWAASLLYTLTGETKYRQMALRIGNNLLDLQSDEGFWSGVGQTTPSHDSTAERVVWMNEICQAIARVD